MARKYVVGAAIAVGALLVVPGLATALGRAGRPLARAAVRSGAVAWDEFRRAGAETFEHVEDLAEEFREEVAAHRARTAEAEEAAATEGHAPASNHAG